MISKSTKTKRRQHAAFYQRVSTIEQTLIDVRGNTKFYLLSVPVNPRRSHHIEVRGKAQLLGKYREMLEYCRA